MSLNWIDVSDLSINVLLLLESVQLSWLPGWLPEAELGTALTANPAVEWYLRHKNPTLNAWVDRVLQQSSPDTTPEGIRQAELTILRSINDLVVYAVNPQIYVDLPFQGWDSSELSSLADFSRKTVIDVGAGTGRLTFIAADAGASPIFAVEPVGNLRAFLKETARNRGLKDVYTMDGLITDMPFPANFGDIVMAGHVFGDHPKAEHAELVRVAKPGGMVILCPGNNDVDDDRHRFLVDQGFAWSRFEEPGDGMKRKYWKREN
jgi:SAM-dependent methyltransferase